MMSEGWKSKNCNTLIINVLLAIIFVLFLPSQAFANGGLPIIFVLNAYSFIIGAVFVFLIEYNYLKKRFGKIEKKQIALCVIKFNVASTLFGILIIPVVLMLMRLEPLFYMLSSNPEPSTVTRVMVISILLDFVLAYISTVVIEYFILKRAVFIKGRIDNTLVLRHVVRFNLLSYVFLVLLMGSTIAILSLVYG